MAAGRRPRRRHSTEEDTVRRFQLSTGAWIAFGLIAAAMLIPGISYAAATVTQIAGKNGTTVAQVTAANQLLTAEVAPAGFWSTTTTSDLDANGTCRSLTTTPASNGVIVREIRGSVFAGTSQDTITFYAGSGCIGPVIGLFAGGGDTNFAVPIDPGVSIPANTTISYLVIDQSAKFQSWFWLDGYKVPKGNPIAGAVRHAGLPRG
jgi:hypothetical protein